MPNPSLSPAELRNQAARMSSLMNDYDSLFSELVRILHTVNNNWSENLSNNFEGKISSAKQCCAVILDTLQFGIDAANQSADSFESIDIVLSNRLSDL